MAPEPGTEARYIPVKVLFVLGVVWVVALPLLVAVILTALLPEIGRLREGGAWRVLHLLWIYPLFAVVTWLFIEPIAKRVGQVTSRVGENVTEVVLAWLLLATLLGVYFERFEGAAVAGAVALAGLHPLARLLERTLPPDDEHDRTLTA